jgi:hypothetical protein
MGCALDAVCCAGYDDLYSTYDPLYNPPPVVQGTYMQPVYLWMMGAFRTGLVVNLTGTWAGSLVWSQSYTIASVPTAVGMPLGVCARGPNRSPVCLFVHAFLPPMRPRCNASCVRSLARAMCGARCTTEMNDRQTGTKCPALHAK